MSLLIIFSLFFNFLVTPVLATDASPSANQTQDIVNIVQQKVKEKLNSITSPTPSNKPKSFFGTITQIDSNQISISYQNKIQVISIGDSTAYIDLKRNKSKFTNFKVGQGILAMGYLNADTTLTGKRIVATDLTAIDNPNQVVIGQIVDVSKTSPILVLIPSKDKNTQYQIKTDSKTSIVDLKGNKLDSKILVSGKKIIVIISPDSKIVKTFYASEIINLDSTTSSVSPTPTANP
jgi:hypothetical protein